jgi:hypothetical protein
MGGSFIPGHVKAKSPNSCYRLDDEFVAIPKAPAPDWRALLGKWASADAVPEAGAACQSRPPDACSPLVIFAAVRLNPRALGRRGRIARGLEPRGQSPDHPRRGDWAMRARAAA